MNCSCDLSQSFVFSIQALGGARRKTESIDQHGAVVDGPNNAKPAHLCAGLLADGRKRYSLDLVNQENITTPLQAQAEKSVR